MKGIQKKLSIARAKHRVNKVIVHPMWLEWWSCFVQDLAMAVSGKQPKIFG